MGGFFSKPRKATDAFINNPLKIIRYDLENLENKISAACDTAYSRKRKEAKWRAEAAQRNKKLINDYMQKMLKEQADEEDKIKNFVKNQLKERRLDYIYIQKANCYFVMFEQAVKAYELCTKIKIDLENNKIKMLSPEGKVSEAFIFAKFDDIVTM